MNLFSIAYNDIQEILMQLHGKDALKSAPDVFSRIAVDPPKDYQHGDLTTNAAMVLSKSEGKNPRILADLLLPEIQKLEYVEDAKIAGAGFINIKVKKILLHKLLASILTLGDLYGSCDVGKGTKINVEYVSANPTGPLHAGHSRPSVAGDVIANLLLKTGFDVQKEYYINDGGGQTEKLAKSAYVRYREALGQDIGEIPEGLYPGEYLKDVGQGLVQKYGDQFLHAPQEVWLEEFRVFTVNFLMDEIKTTLEKFGITNMVFRSEDALVKDGSVDAAIETLRAKGLIYKGILEAPKGVQIDEWESKEQLIFKSSEFGDDVDRPLQRSDGSWTYFAKDLAYHYDKYRRGFKQQIDVLGADHGGYVKRIVAGLKALTDGDGVLEVRICQMVNFLDNGQPVKMSKRAGTFITLEDIIDAVGKDVARFVMLTRKNDAHIDLDYSKVKEQSKENPVFYVQYAHARCHSVFRQTKEVFPDMRSSSDITLDSFNHLSPDEIHLLWFIGQFPMCVEHAALLKEPHRIVYYLYDLSALFHSLWNKGKEDAMLRFILPDHKDTTFARICLISALQTTLKNGLEILGVKALEEMRS